MTRTRSSFSESEFRKPDFIEYSGGPMAHSSLLNIAIRDGIPALVRRRAAEATVPGVQALGMQRPKSPDFGGPNFAIRAVLNSHDTSPAARRRRVAPSMCQTPQPTER